MNTEREYSITLKFPSYTALMNHLAEYGELLIQKTAPQLWETNDWETNYGATATPTEEPAAAAAPKNPNDKRGKHTKEYHKLARDMKELQPELSYRDCYKSVSKKAEA